MTDKPLFVYAEAPPLGENVVTHGMYRAATPMLRAIKDATAGIALFPWDRRFRPAMLDPQLAPLCTTAPTVYAWIRTASRRLNLPHSRLMERVAAATIGPQAKHSSASHILCLEGSDPDALANVARIAARAGKPFSVYVVDDFLTPMRLAGEREYVIAKAAERARAALQKASHVFSISDGLGRLFEKEFGVHPTTLPLVFELGQEYAQEVRKQIIFVGSVNFLYEDALRALVEDVGAVRTETGEDLTIRFTSMSANMLGELPSYVHVEPLGSAESLAREISASLFAFLPYSFNPKVANMVRTSFPSKLMEYLAHARSIVAFAPDYANSTAYFLAHGLPEVIHDRAALRLVVRQHLREAPVHSALYRRQLRQVHAPQAARQTILSTLFGA